MRQYVRADANARWVYLGDNHACGTSEGAPRYSNRFYAEYVCTLTPSRGNPKVLEASIGTVN